MSANTKSREFYFGLAAFLTKRRRFRFTLRSILIVVTLLAMGLGYFSFRAQDQRSAVARIHALGGYLQYDNNNVDNNPRWSPAGWLWLRRLVGDDYFQDVVFVNLDQTKVSDADLRVIGKLRRTTGLSLNRTDVSDEGLALINGMTELKHLKLEKTNVTSEGIHRLPWAVSSLLLGDTNVGDEALIDLSDYVSLGLDGTPITPDGFKQLKGFKNLRNLSLQRTAVGDESVPILAQLTTLQLLNLKDTKISGEGLFALRNSLPNCQIVGDWNDLSRFGKYNPRMVERIRSKGSTTIVGRATIPIQRDQKRPEKLVVLSGPLIADFHLSLLEQLDSLEVLDLRGASVTDDGVQKLQKALPKLRIYR
ncbi:MAG: hypothetical protein IAF94_08215 [Pirellulaceae bacterium]|nr:hypothetical protein [Pirellulaceae bacterium]